MSSTPPPDPEVEEGSPVGEAICEDSPVSEAVCEGSPVGEAVCEGSPVGEAVCEGSPVGEAICEASSPENTMQSSGVTEIEENTEQTDENLFPFNSVSVELYEGPEESEDSSQTRISEYEAAVEDSNNETQDMQGVANTLCSSPSNSRDSRSNVDAILSDASKSNLDEPDAFEPAIEPAAIEPTTEDSLDTYDPNIVIKDEIMDTEELQKTYIEDFLYSNTSASFDEASNSANDEKGCPLSRFSKIVRAVEQADYETLQMLYQLLYQRSAWDTQEILTQRILEFSGFNFGQNSEDYFNREMMLRTQPDHVLRKIGAILCLEMRKFSDTGKERLDLIAGIMEFLAKPKRKSRAPRGGTDVRKDEERDLLLATDKCGCRNRCLKKFTEAQKKNILRYLELLETEKMLDAYIISLFHSKKIERKPGAADESKKLKEVLYQYKVKHGKKEVPVCKGAFCILHGIKLGKVNQLQNKVKSGGMAPLDPKDYPPFITDGVDEKDVDVNENEVKDLQKSPNQLKSPIKNRSKKKSSAGPKSSKSEARKSIEDFKTEEELKESITSQKVIPKVVIEKVDLKAVTSIKISEIEDTDISGVKIAINTDKVDADVKENQKSDGEMKENQKSDGEKKENNKPEKLKDFPLVVRSIENAPEELLIDIHFLLYLSSASADKVKENILEFSGFPFDADTEEFDERNEFLQRMSNKIITDVARSFSLGLLSTKEDTIKNILSFLSKPDESYLRAVAVPVILSDVELDDIGDMSDSDESITCEVVEKKVECIDLISSGEESDKEDKAGKEKQAKKPSPPKKTPVPQSATNTSIQTSTLSPLIMPGSTVSNSTPSAPASTAAPVSNSQATPGQKRTLRNFETICKIVNTHPHEYLVDIFDLLYLKKHEPSTLRNDILDFSGFTFEKGSTEYIKRKQLLDRMLYNSVRRIYNTLIHTTTEVKVYSKPTMIAEIFQFLFKLPDHDTSVRPPPTTKPALKPTLAKGCPVVKVVPGMAGATVPPAPLPSQTGKLSDLKRVFQRVACFPCEYLIDVHKLLFMSDCDPKVIRQNIFGFKGFSFGVDSPEFQQRKMYLEYLTFHSLRKISSVLTTRSVDLRNSTKHELATHLTQVLAEYCNTYVETEPIGTETPANEDNQNTSSAPTSTTTTSPTTTSTSTPDQINNDVENIVVTPILDPLHANPSSGSPESVQTPESTSTSEPKSSANTVVTPKLKNVPPKETPKSVTIPPPLAISIVDTRSIRSPATTTTAAPRGRRKRKSTPVKEVLKDRPPPADASQFADINLPEIEQYRQLYGQNLNIYNPNLPTISAYSGSGVVPQSFPHLVPQTMPFPVVHTFPSSIQVQNPYPGVPQPSQMIGLQPPIAPGLVQQSNIPPNKQNEVIVPGECVLSDTICEEPASKKARNVISSGDKSEKSASKKTGISTDDSFSLHNKLRDAMSTADDEEDCDKPLASLIGHPIDSVLKKHICDIVEQTDLQDITINGVIQKIYSMYPKFDLSYRKEFIKSTLRSILYRLGEQKNSTEKSGLRETSSPDCSVTTTDNRDSPLPESCDVEAS